MRSDPETIDLATYRRLTAKLPRAPKKKAAAKRVVSEPRDGLTTLLRAGWSTRTRNGGAEHQLYQAWGVRLETQWHADQSDACREAKELQERIEHTVQDT